MSFWFVIAAIVFLIVVAVLLWRQRPGQRPEARPIAPASFLEQRDPTELLEGLPESVRLPLERMIAAHAQLSGHPQKASRLPAQATDLIGLAATLALEASRLEDYLGRYDLRQVAQEAMRDPSRRVLLSDLERMGGRHAALTEAIEVAATALEAAQGGSPTGLESVVHRLRLL